MEINPTDLPWKSMYKLLIGAVVPRPIGWISTVDSRGAPNLAPFSYFNAVSANPPHLIFAPSVRGTDFGLKDTLLNVRTSGEFVANIVTEDLAEAMNITSTEFPPDVNEFEAAGLTPAPSLAVTPPRVRESPIHFECRLSHLITLGEGPGGGTVVIGRIIHVHVDERVMLGEDKIDPHKLKPIGRMAGGTYSRVTDLFEMQRPPSQIRSRDQR
jgi:flavin reductase (DIM6/NTAB) family NADH-FMN oxidoreductase RutF